MNHVRTARVALVSPAICAAILLSSCSLLQKQEPAPAVEDPEMKQLADVAHSIEDQWNVLGGIEKAKNPDYLKYLDDYGSNYPAELSRRVTLNWEGPIEPLLKLMARNAGYTFNVVGVRPAKPILVFIEAKDMRVGDVIRDVGYQVGGRAGVRAMTIPGRQSLELAYVPE